MAFLDCDYLHDEAAAYRHLEALRWPAGRQCPHCGILGRSAPLQGSSTRIGTYKCYACRKPFTVKVGTRLEGSHIPLHIWLRAICLLSASPKPIGGSQLHQLLGISIKSALFLISRIQDAVAEEAFLLPAPPPQAVPPEPDLPAAESGPDASAARAPIIFPPPPLGSAEFAKDLPQDPQAAGSSPTAPNDAGNPPFEQDVPREEPGFSGALPEEADTSGAEFEPWPRQDVTADEPVSPPFPAAPKAPADHTPLDDSFLSNRGEASHPSGDGTGARPPPPQGPSRRSVLFKEVPPDSALPRGPVQFPPPRGLSPVRARALRYVAVLTVVTAAAALTAPVYLHWRQARMLGLAKSAKSTKTMRVSNLHVPTPLPKPNPGVGGSSAAATDAALQTVDRHGRGPETRAGTPPPQEGGHGLLVIHADGTPVLLSRRRTRSKGRTAVPETAAGPEPGVGKPIREAEAISSPSARTSHVGHAVSGAGGDRVQVIHAEGAPALPAVSASERIPPTEGGRLLPAAAFPAVGHADFVAGEDGVQVIHAEGSPALSPGSASEGIVLASEGGKQLPAVPPLPNRSAAPTAESSAASPQAPALILRGLRLVAKASQIEPRGSNTPGVNIVGLTLLRGAAVRGRLAVWLGRPVSQDMLQAISRTITDWYHSHDQPFVDVTFPANQDITDGVIQVVVTEARAGRILARNNRWFSNRTLVNQVALKPGDPIQLSDLQADRDWLNQNPFHAVDITAEKGQTPGTTDIVINTVREDFPLRVRAAYDNSGPQILGADRWTVGLDWGNALWLNDQFSYQYSANQPLWQSVQGKEATFETHAVSYLARLAWQDQLAFFGAYARSVPDLGADLGLTGINWQVGLRYIKQLPSWGDLTQQLQFGFDFKSSNSNLIFGGLQVSNTTSQIAQFPLQYTGSLKDLYGQTSFDNILVFSPGHLTSLNTDAIFQTQGASKARYVYDHVAITRLTGLPQSNDWLASLGWLRNISSLTQLVGQIASANLLPSEEVGIGGSDTIPGYDQRLANGSWGVIFSEEIISPPFGLGQRVFGDSFKDQAQVSLFWDEGAVRNTGPTQTTTLNDLESAGVGFRYSFGRYLSLHADYGLQLRELSGVDHGSRIDVAVNLNY